jgi:hypothetical protein
VRRWLFGPDVILQSALPEDACLQRLRDAIDSEWNPLGRKPVVGWVGDRAFRLRKRSRTNPFQVFLEGETVAEVTGTKIRCRVGLQDLVFVGWGIGLLIVFGILVEKVLEIFDSPPPPNALSDAAGIAGLLAAMAIGIAIARSAARQDESFLVDFVQRMLVTQPLDRQ